MLTITGEIRLVDINNISRVSFDSEIRIDDRGYPVCDRSIQALSMLEQKLLARPLSKKDPIYKTFLAPDRIKKVEAIEEEFNRGLNTSTSYLGTS